VARYGSLREKAIRSTAAPFHALQTAAQSHVPSAGILSETPKRRRSLVVADVLTGVLPDYAASFLDLDAGGAFYLYYDGKSDWRVATNPDGNDTTPLHGQVANDGQFWFAGPYDSFLANGDVFIRGKIKFHKKTFDPKSISGKLYFVSEDITTSLDLKFKAVGAPVNQM
jgi:hypothetical protein